MDKNKIISSLALAGILTASAFGGTNVRAADADYLKPVGVYKSYKGMITEQKTVIPYLVKDLGKGVTVGDLRKEFGKGLTKVAGETNLDVLNSNKILGTGTEFVAGEVTYTLVVYGDFNGDGKIMPNDASAILNAYVNEEELTSEKKIGSDVTGDGKVMPNDASRILNAYVNEKIEVTVAEKEDTEKATIVLKEDGVELEKDEDGKYIKYAEEGVVLKLDTIVAEALDNYEGNVSYKVSSDKEEVTVSETPVEVTYTVSDIAGNTETVILKVVADSEGPEITVTGETTVYVKNGDTLDILKENMPTLTAIDKIDGEMPVTIKKMTYKSNAEDSEEEVIEDASIEKIDVTKDGTYTIIYTSVDSRGNAAKEDKIVTVVVDTVAPTEVNVEYKDPTGEVNGTATIRGELTVTITANEKIQAPDDTWTLSEDGKSISKNYDKNTVTAEAPEGEKVIVKDLAGNEKEAFVQISNLDNEISGLEVTYSNVTKEADAETGEETEVVHPTNGDVTVTIEAEEKIAIVAEDTEIDWDNATNTITITPDYTENGTHTVTIRDEIGNEKEVTIDVRGIDKVKPVAGVAYDPTEKTTGNVTVTLTAEEEIDKDAEIVVTTTEGDPTSKVEGFTWEVEENIAKATFTDSGIYYVTITDLAGNESLPIKVDVTNIDREAPVCQEIVYKVNGTSYTIYKLDPEAEDIITKLEDLPLTNKDVEVTVKYDEEVKAPEGWAVNASDANSITKLYGTNSEYTVVASDLRDVKDEENPVAFKITNIDKEAPVVKNGTEVFANGTYKNVTINFDEGTALLTKKGETAKTITTGKALGNADKSEDGEYTLVVEDKAGNKTTVRFTIDNLAPIFADLKKDEDGNVTDPDKLTDILLSAEGTVPATATDGGSADTVKITDIKYTSTELGATEETLSPAEGETELTSALIKIDGEHDGLYVVTYEASDVAGNKSVVTRNIKVDSTKATVKVEKDKENEEARAVTVVLTFNEAMQEQENWSADATKKIFSRTYTENTNASIKFKDLAGNETTVEFSINNIDRNAPVLESKVFSPDDRETKTQAVDVTLTFNKEVKLPAGWAYGKDANNADLKTVITKTYNANAEEVVVSDLAGNKRTVTLGIDNIDTTVPVCKKIVYTVKGTDAETEADYIIESDNGEDTITAIQDLPLTKEDVKVTITYSEKVTVEGWKAVEGDENSIYKVFKANTENPESVVAKDEAQNEATEKNISVEVIDKDAPVVNNGAEALKAKIYGSVNLSFEDAHKVKVALYNDADAEITEPAASFEVASGITAIELPGEVNGTLYSDGSYKIVVEDELGNKTEVVFTIDSTKPTFDAATIEDGKRYKEVTPVFTEGPAILTKADGTVVKKEVVSGTTISNPEYADGEYKLTLKDAAGNTESVTFILDNVGPELENISDESNTFGAAVTPTLKTGEKYKTVKLEAKNSEGEYEVDDTYIAEGLADADGLYSALAEVSADGEYRLTLTDDLENEAVYEFTIDSTAPAATAFVTVAGERKEAELEDAGEYQKVELTLTDKDTLVKVEGNAETAVEGSTIGKADKSEDGTYKLTLVRTVGETDLTTTVTFVIDNEAPEVNMTAEKNNEEVDEYTNGETYQSVTPEATESGLVIELSKYNEATKSYDKITDYTALAEIGEGKDGVYKLVVSDKAGNRVEKSFTIDAKVDMNEPEYSNNGEVIKTFVTVKIAGNEKISAEGFTSVPEEENTIQKIYQENKTETVTITDELGNSQDVEIKVTGIDHDVPTIVGQIDYKYYNVITEEDGTKTAEEVTKDADGNSYVKSNGYVDVTIEASEPIKEQAGWTYVVNADESKDTTKITKRFSKNTQEAGETVKLVDLAGNEGAEQTVVVTTIYDKAPTISGIGKAVDSKQVNSTTKYYLPETVTAEDCKGDAVTVVTTINGVEADNETIKAGLNMSAPTTYTIVYTAIDKAGNKTEVVKMVTITE